MMSDDIFSQRTNLFFEGVSKMYRAFNRAGSTPTFKGKSEDLSKFLSRVDDAEILPFFSHVIGSEDALPTDKRLKQICLNWKKGDLTLNPDLGYYDPSGSWVPSGTFQTLSAINFKNLIHQLQGFEIEILTQAKHGHIEFPNQKIDELQNRKYWWPKGKHQIPFKKWGKIQVKDFDEYNDLCQKKLDYANKMEEKYSTEGVHA